MLDKNKPGLLMHTFTSLVLKIVLVTRLFHLLPVLSSIRFRWEATHLVDWFLAVPRSKDFAIPDDACRCVLRDRLRSDLVAFGSNCAYVIPTYNRTCGKDLASRLDHAFSFAARLRFAHGILQSKINVPVAQALWTRWRNKLFRSWATAR